MVVPCAVSPTDCSGWPASCSNGECYSTPIMVRQLPRRLRRSLGSPLASDLAGGRALRASVGQEATSGTGRLAPARSLLGHGATLAREGKTRHVGCLTAGRKSHHAMMLARAPASAAAEGKRLRLMCW